MHEGHDLQHRLHAVDPQQHASYKESRKQHSSVLVSVENANNQSMSETNDMEQDNTASDIYETTCEPHDARLPHPIKPSAAPIFFLQARPRQDDYLSAVPLGSTINRLEGALQGVDLSQ